MKENEEDFYNPKIDYSEINKSLIIYEDLIKIGYCKRIIPISQIKIISINLSSSNIRIEIENKILILHYTLKLRATKAINIINQIKF